MKFQVMLKILFTLLRKRKTSAAQLAAAVNAAFFDDFDHVSFSVFLRFYLRFYLFYYYSLFPPVWQAHKNPKSI